MEILDITFSDVKARFGRMRDFSAPFTLLWIIVQGKGIDIGQQQQITLRNEDDLKKFDPFWGFAGVSLANLDLREYRKLLDTMPFDSQTVWPETDKMPEGFDPAALLEDGKNPGLGIRSLHKQGIDGRGIGIAIIDQPLLKDHIEYADRIERYEAIDVFGVPIQMHGPPVSSIAVGKTCGVAPQALLYYYAVPPWKWLDNKPWSETVEKIIKLNKNLEEPKKIRVISISLGAFSQRQNYDLWEKVVDHAAKEGILVVTCDPDFLNYGTLALIPGKDPENPSNYRRGKYSASNDVLLVPTGNKTIASYYGSKVYTYDRTGGMSWAVPYLAGLAVLAYQVNPEIEPKEIVELWLKTATRTDAGPVINPIGFIEAVRETK
jgi:subtilisin family serine protease